METLFSGLFVGVLLLPIFLIAYSLAVVLKIYSENTGDEHEEIA